MLERTQLRSLPKGPGGYLLKDKEGVPLFISWTNNIKDAVTSHSKAIGSPREKAIALAYRAYIVETLEGASDEEIKSVIAKNEPEFNRPDFDATKAEASRLTITISPGQEAIMRSFAKLRFVRAQARGEMVEATPAEYIRYLINQDIREGEASIKKRRTQEVR